jgi:hypothetical protein
MQDDIRSGQMGLGMRWLMANIVGFTLGGASGVLDGGY